MAEESVPVPAEVEKMEETTEPSTSEQVEGTDVDTEAKKLMGVGSRNMVMKDIRAAVNAFQEASSLLGKKYGETADQCADAFFSYGMALLELARMENGVLGNALEGMPEDEEEDGEKTEDPNIPSAANLDEQERETLREQVYDAMAEKEKQEKSDAEAPKTNGKENGDVQMEEDKPSEDKASEKTNGDAPVSDEKADEAEKSTAATEEKAADEPVTEEKAADVTEKAADEPVTEEKAAEVSKSEETETKEKVEEAKASEKKEDSSEPPAKEDSKTADVSEPSVKESEESKPVTEEKEGEKPPAVEETKEQPDEKEEKTEEEAEPMEGEEEEGAESEDGDEHEGTEEKGDDEDEVGNLQLAWEFLDLAKVIYKRQQNKEAQLKAAQANLRLGEVSIESENYGQAIEDFIACLNIQKEHLEEHDRLLAETHYQLGLAYQYSSKHDSAISHFTQSTEVIEKRVAVLTEQLKAAGESTEELQKEMDELKGLLPDIREKIEDSKEALKTAEATEKALQETLVGGSSGFSQENGSTSASAAPEKSADSTVPVTNCVSDISHLVRKKRKPEEESPLKEAKKPKADPVENGSENGSGNGDAVVPTNEEAEKAEEAETQTPMETTAVGTTA